MKGSNRNKAQLDKMKSNNETLIRITECNKVIYNTNNFSKTIPLHVRNKNLFYADRKWRLVL